MSECSDSQLRSSRNASNQQFWSACSSMLLKMASLLTPMRALSVNMPIAFTSQ